MSCSDNLDLNCDEVLDQVYEYLDGEIDAESVTLIKAHLDECSPCLDKYGLEKAVRGLVERSCHCVRAPERLRQQIQLRITQIRVTSAQEPTEAP